MAQLQNPFLRGWYGAEESNRANAASGLQQAQGVMQMQGLLAKQQQEQQYRGLLAAATTPEEQMAVATKYMGPDALARVQQGSLDRKATLTAANTNAQAMREQRLYELSQRGEQEIARVREAAAQQRITREEADRREAAMRENMARLAASLRPATVEPAVQTHTDGTGKLWERSRGGAWAPAAVAPGAPGMSPKPPIAAVKDQQARAKMNADLDAVIPNLEAISKDGGLLDQSTGSGAGALVDMAAGFIGKATPGSIAVGKLKPIVDPILKLVPRFEGPQSDKDTASYRDAAGDLANPATPNERKKAAAKTILEMYKKRRGQFSTTDYEASASEAPAYSGQERRAPPANAPRVVDW